MSVPSNATQHTLPEDAQAFVLSTSLCAFGLLMLTHLGFITGQTAGLAVLISYMTGWPFGAVFFVVNVPFYLLAWMRMGKRFTIKTFLAVALLSVISSVLPSLIIFETLEPLTGVMLAGAVTGLGLIVLFRHGASLGGIGVLALFIQDRTTIRAGWVQLSFDLCLFAAAFFVIGGAPILYSLVGAIITNLIVAVNHRPDRYTGR